MGKTVSEKAKKLKYLFILNPVAGVGARRDFLAMIDEACKQKGVKHKILFTRCAGDAKKSLKRNLTSSTYSLLWAEMVR